MVHSAITTTYHLTSKGVRHRHHKSRSPFHLTLPTNERVNVPSTSSTVPTLYYINFSTCDTGTVTAKPRTTPKAASNTIPSTRTVPAKPSYPQKLSHMNCVNTTSFYHHQQYYHQFYSINTINLTTKHYCHQLVIYRRMKTRG